MLVAVTDATAQSTCAATQSLGTPATHAIPGCPFLAPEAGVCCFDNASGHSVNFLTVCRAVEDYIDCSSECNASA